MNPIIATDLQINGRTQSRIKHEIHRMKWMNMCNLYQMKNVNGYQVFTELKGKDERDRTQEIHDKESQINVFEGILESGKHYIFGIVENRRTHKRFLFLADINRTMHISDDNKLFYPGTDEEIIIHVK